MVAATERPGLPAPGLDAVPNLHPFRAALRQGRDGCVRVIDRGDGDAVHRGRNIEDVADGLVLVPVGEHRRGAIWHGVGGSR